MEKESAKIKIRPNTSLNDASRSLEEKKMNLSCSDVIRYFQDVISMRFGSSELSTFNFDISTKGHLKISDLKSGEVFVGSCHFKGKQGQYNPSEIKTLLTVLANSIKHRELEERNEPKFRKVEAKRSKMHPGGLKDWVENEKWVDVRRPKKDGGYEPCGRNDTSKGSKPVCVPSNKAKSLDKKELENRKRQKAKKEKEPNPGKKPNTTKYTEEAGGKSNVSDNNNIRFIGSMIPLSELKSIQPRFIKISGIEDEGGIGSDNPFNPLEEMGYEERNFGQEPSPEEKDQYKPFFISMYFPYYKSLITNILNPMLEDSKYYNILEFQGAFKQKEPEAIKLFLNANEYLSGTSKSRGGSAMAQIVCMNMALNAKKFVDTGIDIFNFDNKESSDVEAAWELVSSGNFFEHQLEEEND
jgi:hypothetical protein